MMIVGIEFQRIGKAFDKKRVLDNISLQIGQGAVYCLLGRNGAGKSTAINIACSILRPDTGNVLINGMSLASKRDALTIRETIGLQGQFDPLINELSGVEYLEMIALIYRLDKKAGIERINNLLEYFFDEGESLSRAIGGYSTGMRRKLMLCAAFLHKPPVVFLDEPFANLDPLAADKLCQFIRAYSTADRTIFVSSHDLLYVDKIATHIGVLENGNLVFNDTLEEFLHAGDLRIDESLLQYIRTQDRSEMLHKII